MGWFTYETDIGIALDEDAHRWLVAVGDYLDDTAELELLAVDGGTFNGPDAVTETPVGIAELWFRSCTEAEFSYQLDAGLSGSIRLSRLLPDALCDQLAAREGSSLE